MLVAASHINLIPCPTNLVSTKNHIKWYPTSVLIQYMFKYIAFTHQIVRNKKVTIPNASQDVGIMHTYFFVGLLDGASLPPDNIYKNYVCLSLLGLYCYLIFIKIYMYKRRRKELSLSLRWRLAMRGLLVALRKVPFLIQSWYTFSRLGILLVNLSKSPENSSNSPLQLRVSQSHPGYM